MLRGLGGDDHAGPQGSMGIATCDFDNDGDFDFYVTNFSGEYNTYYEQRTAGAWQDRTAKLQLTEPTLPVVGFGTEVIDLDFDGTAELVVTNGHVDMFSRDDELSVYAQPMQVFRRSDAGTFHLISDKPSSISSKVSPTENYRSNPHVGRAIWRVDADRDGRPDLVVTHQTEPVALLMNRSETVGQWIAIDLRGRSCARDAVGAVVEVRCGERSWSQGRCSGDGYLCSGETTLRFGIGKDTRKCDVKVTWSDQTTQLYRDLGPNRSWLIIQGDDDAFSQTDR